MNEKKFTLTNSPPSQACNYWASGKSQPCKLASGGLYIPMPHHIEIYCATPEYISCPQYMDEILTRKNTRVASEAAASRRRFVRIKRNSSVILTLCNENGEPLKILDKNATILDLSWGGMRIESTVEMPQKSIIDFTFGEDFIIPGLRGKGQSRWNSYVKGTNTHQTGLAFLSDRTGAAMATILPS